MSATRRSCSGLLAGIVLVVTGIAAVARAGESADRGISLSAWAGGAVDRGVTTSGGSAVHPATLVVGVTGVGNIERVAIGGAVDVKPTVFGDGRLSLSALLGYHQQMGRNRVQLLGEAGERRYSDVGGSPMARQAGPDPWLPFVGARLGLVRTVPAHGFVEVGVWLFARYDLHRTTVTSVSTFFEGTRTDYRVGGAMAGLALQAGLRLDSPHPWNQGVEEQ
jgi:hypothetical protein